MKDGSVCSKNVECKSLISSIYQCKTKNVREYGVSAHKKLFQRAVDNSVVVYRYVRVVECRGFSEPS
jgi:hypothetical protein